MRAFYEQEAFVRDPVPIRVFRHHYVNDRMFTIEHWHQSVELTLMLKGTIVHTLNNQSMVSGPGELCIVNSGVIHSNHCSETQPEIDAVTVQISISFLEQWMGKGVFLNVPSDPGDREEVNRIIEDLGTEDDGPEEFRLLNRLDKVFHLMVLLSHDCERVEKRNRLQEEGLEHFKEVLDYVETHYEEDLSLEVLAEKFGYSPSYLSRVFKKHVGNNFYRHLQAVRLQAAITDLRQHPEKSILDCALDHGFPNVKSFIHFFKQELGVTPSEWRKQAGDNSGFTIITVG